MVSEYVFIFKQKTAYDMRISDWSSDVCSSDLRQLVARTRARRPAGTLQADHAGGRRRRLLAATRLRARHHREDGLCRLLSGRLRLHRVGQAERLPGWSRRSEARPVGKEWVSKCMSRWAPYH